MDKIQPTRMGAARGLILSLWTAIWEQEKHTSMMEFHHSKLKEVTLEAEREVVSTRMLQFFLRPY